MEIEIGKPSIEDWEQVRALRVTSIETDPEAFGQTSAEAHATREEEWRRRLAAGQYVCAKHGNKIVGMVCAVPETNEKTRHIANIYSMYVLPEFRGQGIGRALLSALISDVEKNMPNVIKLELRVSASKPAARELYKSLGFKEVALLEKEMFVDGVFVDEYEMHKFIRHV